MKKGLVALFVSRVRDHVVFPARFALPRPGSITLTWPNQLDLAEHLDALALDEPELAEEAEALFVVEADPSKERPRRYTQFGSGVREKHL